ncbi:MAG: chromate transporter [Clostridiales bacterium]|nr:chromate transporter [Clostridiales bacterium]
MKRTVKFYFKLFMSVFVISAITVGGGYVIVPLMKKEYVDKLKWIKSEEMVDLIAIAQSSPGAMAVNTAVLVGYRTGGVLGAVIGALGAVIPPLISITLIYFAYAAFKENKIAYAFLSGVKIGVAAVIIDVVIGMVSSILKKKSILSIFILLISFLLVYFARVNVIIVIFGCILIGIISSLFQIGGRNKSGGSQKGEA